MHLERRLLRRRRGQGQLQLQLGGQGQGLVFRLHSREAMLVEITCVPCTITDSFASCCVWCTNERLAALVRRTAFPALSSPDKYLGAHTVQILQPSFDRFFSFDGLHRQSSWSHRAPRSRKNRPIVALLLIENVFVCCTRFIRIYIHRVSSRHWPSPLTLQEAARIAQGLLLTSSPIAKSQKKPGRGAPSR